MTPRSVDEKIFAIVLAAGSGTRFRASTHKLLAPLRGRPVYAWVLESVIGAGLAGVIVVTGAAPLELPAEVVRAHNDRWETGQASSLQTGLVAATDAGAAAVVVGLADQPFVTSTSWSAVAAAPFPIAVATYDGVRGQPVRLHRSVWPLLPTEGDQGARNLIALRPDLVGEVICSGSSADIDTMEDLQQWNSSTNS